MPTFLLNHLKALTVGPTQQHMLAEWLQSPYDAADEVLIVLRGLLDPQDERLKVRYCCPAALNTRGRHHDAFCTGPVEVEK